MAQDSLSISELADLVNEWCHQHHVQPLHQGAAPKVSIRNIRYYQSLGLVDRPARAAGKGFSEKHRLQITAIRLLQARGLPLNKIKALLRGRSSQQLNDLAQQWLYNGKASQVPLPLLGQEWKLIPIQSDVLILTSSGREITPTQRLKLQTTLRDNSLEAVEVNEKTISESAPAPAEPDSLGIESFRPETD